jgi:hypothetical protein
MKQQYPFNAYDRYLCLRLNPGAWVVMAYILRPYMIMTFSLANKQDRWGLINLIYQDRLAMALSALAAVPVFFLIYAFVKRKPGVTGFARRVWHKGYLLIMISLLLNILIVFVPTLAGKTDSVSYAGMLQLAITIFMIAYIATSQRVRDTFADYPEKTAEDD